MEKNRLSQASRVYLITALIALVVSLSVVALGYQGISDDVRLSRVVTTSEKPVRYTTDTSGDLIPRDFTETSRKVLDALVHITSRGSQPYMREYRQPFRRYSVRLKSKTACMQTGVLCTIFPWNPLKERRIL